MTARPPRERGVRIALGAVALAGLGVAGYLTAARAAGHAPACVVGGGCATVQASRYAELASIPVAWLGVAGYAALLVAALLGGPAGRLLGLFTATLAVAFSGWLTYVEIAEINAVCAWCVASAALTVLALALAGARALVADRPAERPRPGPGC